MRLGTLAVFVIAGILLVSSAVTSGGTDLRTDKPSLLRDLVAQQTQRHAQLSRQAAALRSQVDLLAATAGVPELNQAQRTAKALSAPAGFTAVSGTGIRVTLTDAPKQNAALGQATNPDDLLVHQQDVESVMNALWRGGATAMTVQGRRIISTSAPQCVGNVILVDGVVYSPPYVIAATGNPVALNSALETEPGVNLFRQYVTLFGLGYKVTPLAHVVMPAYQGSVAMQYAKVITIP